MIHKNILWCRSVQQTEDDKLVLITVLSSSVKTSAPSKAYFVKSKSVTIIFTMDDIQFGK